MKQQYVKEDFPLINSGYSNALNSKDFPRQRWYFIKEAFSPKLVEKAIEQSECQEGDIIVDPFCGSGTVPLVASTNGYRGIGIEVNPFLAFVANTKLLQSPPKKIEEQIDKITAGVERGEISSLESFSTFSRTDGAQKWLFNQEVLRAFTGGWNVTLEFSASMQKIFQLALLGAAMDTSNATRDGKALRYRKAWKDLKYDKQDFIEAFKERIEKIKTDLIICPDLNQSLIIPGDSRQELNKLTDRFKLCVTSPPYLNSFDYTDVYRPELFLGRFVLSPEGLRALRQKTVRSHVQAKWKDPIKKNFGEKYEKSIKLLSQRTNLLWNPRLIIMIQAYFEDIQCVLKDLYRLSLPDAHLWLVVSTSAYAGVEIPVDLIIADIGANVGWQLQEIGVLRYLRTSSQNWKKWDGEMEVKPRGLRESVVIFKA